jgi:hypothetical protein
MHWLMDTCVSRRIDVWKAERREERSIICDAQGHTYPLSCSYKATAITCATLCINQRAFTMLTQYEYSGLDALTPGETKDPTA